MRWKFKNIYLKSLQVFISICLVVAPMHFANAETTIVYDDDLARAIGGILLESTTSLNNLEKLLSLAKTSTESVASIRADILKSKPKPTIFNKLSLVDGKKLYINGKASGIVLNITANAPLEVDFKGRSWSYDHKKSADQNYFSLLGFLNQKTTASLWEQIIPQAFAQDSQLADELTNKGQEVQAYVNQMDGKQLAGATVAAGADLWVLSPTAALPLPYRAAVLLGVGGVGYAVGYYGAQAASADGLPDSKYSCVGKSLVMTEPPANGKGPSIDTTFSLQPLRQGRFGTPSTQLYAHASSAQDPDINLTPSQKKFYALILKNGCPEDLVAKANQEVQIIHATHQAFPANTNGKSEIGAE